MSQEIYYQGVGRRKRAVAQTRIFPNGQGEVLIVGKDNYIVPEWVLEPFNLVGQEKKINIRVIVRGGGKQSQLEAIRHGISRALVKFTESYKPTLRKAGFLTRDPREKERKKPGLKRARKAPQWAKR